MKKNPKEPGVIEKLANWKEIDINQRVVYSTYLGLHGIILCHVIDAPIQRVLLVDDESNGGRITLLNLDAHIERRTWKYSNNVCAEELRFDLKQIALDGAEKLKNKIKIN